MSGWGGGGGGWGGGGGCVPRNSLAPVGRQPGLKKRNQKKKGKIEKKKEGAIQH